MSWRSWTVASSAWPAPPAMPMTRSPSAKRVAPGPSAATSPASSRPGMSAGMPGRRRIAARDLDHVGAVQACGADADEDLSRARRRIGVLVDDDAPSRMVAARIGASVGRVGAPSRPMPRDDQARDAAHAEADARAGPAHRPAEQRAADRGRALEGDEPQRHDAPAHLRRRGELERRVADRHEASRCPSRRARGRPSASGRVGAIAASEQDDAERRGGDRERAQARLAARGDEQPAADGADAHRGGHEPEALRPLVERLAGERPAA